MRRWSVWALLATFASFAPRLALAQEDLSVLERLLAFTDAENALYRHLANLAFDALDRRAREIAELRTASDWLARRDDVRRRLRESAGPFPERTPLNARVTGVLLRDGFTVEKLLYESLPGYVVSAAVFVPTNGAVGRRPTIVYASGHAGEGFRSTVYQTAIVNLVKKGFIVLAFDPVGQGERRQYDDPETGISRIGGPTREHSYPGAQIFMAGDSPALYFVWDGIRAIDYLLTRPDVDPERIGVTGRSGGGTQSAYIAAFDERVKAAAPENYLTSFRRLLETVGPQDAEQNFFSGIAHGLDHADLILAHAPKPYLLIATTRDMFSIQGVRETAREARRAFEAMGFEGNFRVVEDDAPHASTKRNREAMYAFFQEALEWPGDPGELDVASELSEPEELYASETGQVATSLGSKGLFEASLPRAVERLDALRASRREPGQADRVAALALRLSGYEAPKEPGETVFRGRLQRDGYAIEKYFSKGEGDYVIPMLVAVPSGESPSPRPAVLYLHPEGKEQAAASGAVDRLAKQGFIVLAPDLLGIGEVGPGDFRGDAYDYGVGVGAYNVWWLANQVGRSLVGIRAGDITRVLRVLEAREDVDPSRIAAVALGSLGPVLLHAAAFEPSLSPVAVVESPLDYEGFATNRYYRPELVHSVVPGAVGAYDLVDLAASLAPRPLLVLDGIDHWGRRVSTEVALEVYDVARQAYAWQAKEAALSIRRSERGAPSIDTVVAWLGREK